MILEFDGGMIKVIPGIEKSSITLRGGSDIVIEADGSITISADSITMEAKEETPNVTGVVFDADYFKSKPGMAYQVMPQTYIGSGCTVPVTGGLLMNQLSESTPFYTAEKTSALDSARDIVVPRADNRTSSRHDMVAHQGGLERVRESVSVPFDGDAFIESHKALAADGGYGNVYPEWVNDPVAKFFNGTLDVEPVVEKMDTSDYLNDLYAKIVLSGDSKARIEMAIEYLDLAGEEVEYTYAIEALDAFAISSDENRWGNAADYLVKLVQEHRGKIAQEEAAEEVRAIEWNAELGAKLEANVELMEEAVNAVISGDEVAYQEIRKKINENLRAMGLSEIGGEEVEEPHCIGYMPEPEGALKALVNSVVCNGEVPTPPITSALDAQGYGRAAALTDDEKPHEIGRGFWEGVDKVVGRGITTVEDRLKRTADTIQLYAKRAKLDGPLDRSKITMKATDPAELAESNREMQMVRMGVCQ